MHLGLQATSADIKRAYRKLSQTYHPDVNSEEGAQEKFIQITRAYSVLGDEEERWVCSTCSTMQRLTLL